jgi:hypothetical protein
MCQEVNPTPNPRDLGNETDKDMTKIPPEWGNKSAAAERNSIISAVVELTESDTAFVAIGEATENAERVNKSLGWGNR